MNFRIATQNTVTNASRVGILLFLFAPTFSFFAQAAERTKADTNREVIRTYAQSYLEEKNYVQAENVLAKYLATDEQDPILWNLMGLAQIAQKKYAQACFGFKKATELFPSGEDRDNALYNFADCLNQGQKQEDSKRVLTKMEEQKSSSNSGGEFAAEVLAKMNKNEILPGQALPPLEYNRPRHLKVSGALGFGYDSNVLLVDDVTATGGSTGQGSFFINPALQGSYYGSVMNQRYDMRLMTAFTDYLSAAEKTFNLLYERADFVVGSGNIRAGLIQELAFLNRNPFQLYFLNGGATVQKRIRLNDTVQWDFEMPIKYKYYYFDRESAPEDDRSGVEVSAKAQYLRVIGDDIRLSSQATANVELPKGNNYKMLELLLPTQVLMPVPVLSGFGILNSFGVEFDGEYYWHSDEGRRDWSVKGSAGLLRPIIKNMRAGLEYSFQKSFSTVEAARYKKHLVTFMLSYDLW